MLRWRTVLVGALVAVSVAVPRSGLAHDGSPVPATCASACVFDVDVPADGLAVPTPTIRVLLPSGYGLEDRRYPVVLLLHGAGDGYETWVDNTDIEEFVAAADLDVIVVMPDGGGKHSEAGWYSDWQDGSRQWETFHVERVLDWVDGHLATLGDGAHRAVMGLSMGGFGALSYAGRHPERFNAAASFSGALDTQYIGPVTGIVFALAHSTFGTPDRRVWGDPVLDSGQWAAHNPTAMARAGGLRHLDGRIWVTTGTGTPGGPAGDDPANPGGYFIEQLAWQQALSFELALLLAGTDFRDRSYLGGVHDWPHWQYALHLVLPEVVDAID